MKKVGLSGDALISWHKGIHVHPIADPDYAKEHLVSLAETVVMLYIYFVIFVLLGHYFVLMGYLTEQTIPWMLIENNAQRLYANVPSAFLLDKFNVFISLITTIMAAKLTRHSFDLIKADLHPKKKRKNSKTS